MSTRKFIKQSWHSLTKRQNSDDNGAGPSTQPTGRAVESRAEPVVPSRDSGSQAVDEALEVGAPSDTTTVQVERLENLSDHAPAIEVLTDVTVTETSEYSPTCDAMTSCPPKDNTETNGSRSPELSSTAVVISESLWNRAYEIARNRGRMLVAQHEFLLSESIDRAVSDFNLPLTSKLNVIGSNKISRDARSRQAQMKELLAVWLREPDNTSERGEDSASNILRKFIRQAVENSLPGAAVGWVGAWHASKILLHPTVDNREDCEGLVYILSRMQLYSQLSCIAESHTRAVNTDSALLGALNNRIVDLYATVLLYIMELTWFHSGEVDGYLMSELQVSRTVSMQRIKQAETNLLLLDEDITPEPLQDLLAERQGDGVTLDDKKKSIPQDIKELLEDLHVDPSSGLLRILSEDNIAVQELYHLLLSLEAYQRFLDWNADCDKVLWITGEAGQGKSLLLTGVVQALWRPKQADAKPSYVSLFFFDYSRSPFDNVAAAIKNLIWFVIAKQPSLSRHLKGKRETTGRKHFDDPNDFPALSSVFFDMLADEMFPNVHYIVNALDEASYSDGSRDIGPFLDLISTSVNGKSSGKIRWLISSNNSEKMKQAMDGRKSFHLDLGTDIPNIESTVDSYIHGQVSRLATHKDYDDDLKDIITRELCKVSCGNYLWVDVVCAALTDEDIWHAEDFLKQLTGNPDLRSLYGYMGNRIRDLPRDGKFCVEVLRVMSLVRRSVSVEELESLVRLAPRVNLRTIIRKCSGFLRISDGFVSFHHQSARDYIRECFLDNTTRLEFHAALTVRCLEALAVRLSSKNKGQQDCGKVAQTGPTRTAANGQYSLIHWITHLYEICKALATGKLRERTRWAVIWYNVKQFLENDFVPWVDVLRRENILITAASELQKVDLCLGGKKLTSSGVRTQIRDAHQFLRLHQSFSAPQEVTTYNTLIFCPEESIIRKSWLPKYAPWLKTPPLVRQRWGDNFNTLKRHKDWVRSITFSTDGRLLASGSDDSSVKIWDVEMGTMQHNFKVQKGWVHSVAFSSRGMVAAGSNYYSITLFSASTGRKHAELENLGGTPYSLCFSPDGTRLASTGSSTVQLWALENECKKWSELKTFNNLKSTANSIAFCAEGHYLAAGSSDGEIAIWNMDTLQLEEAFYIEHDERITCVAFSRDGNLVASGDRAGLAYIWNAKRGDPSIVDAEGPGYSIKPRLRELAPVNGTIESISFSPDAQGSRLAIATQNSIHIWETHTGVLLQVLHTDVLSVTFAPNGSHLASGSYDNSISLWYGTAETAAIESAYSIPRKAGRIKDLTVHPDGNTIAAACQSGSVFLWDLKKKEIIQREMKFGHENAVLSLAFSPNGEYLFSGSEDSTARVCHVATGDLLRSYEDHEGWVEGVAWSHCGKYNATVDNDSVHVREMGGTEEVVLKPESNSGWTHCVAFSPEDHSIVVGGVSRDVVIWKWDPEEKEQKSRVALQGHDGIVEGVLVTRKSRQIVSSGSDGTVRVWDMDTKEQLQVIKVEWAIRKIWTAPQTDDYIMSAHGELSLNRSASSTPAWTLLKLKYENKEKRWWIMIGNNKAIFIPSAFSPSSACVIGDKVIMGVWANLHVYELSAKHYEAKRLGFEDEYLPLRFFSSGETTASI